MQALPTHAEATRGARGEVLDKDIGLPGQRPGDLALGRNLEIERNALLRVIVRVEVVLVSRAPFVAPDRAQVVTPAE